MWRRSWTIALATAAVSIVVACAPAQAATIVVSTRVDDTAANGNCTLREAVIAANTDTAQDACAAGSGADTITVPGGVYRFALGLQAAGEDNAATGDLDLRQPVTIAGAGAAATTVDANHYDRVFDVADNAGATQITGMTIQGGMPPDAEHGGDVRAGRSPVTLLGDIVSRGQLSGNGASGGGISAEGPLTVRDSTISQNSAGQLGAGGGAAVASGSFDNVLVSDNQGGRGAGIYANGALTMTGGEVAANGDATTNQGGGIEADFGPLSLTDLQIDHNTTHNVGGGLFVDIRSSMTATLTRVEIDHNAVASASTDVSGGGIYSIGRLDVLDSWVHDNSALPQGAQSGIGGGIWFRPRSSTDSALAAEVLDIRGSTIGPGNMAATGDGMWLSGFASVATASIVRTTVSGNGADSVPGRGGGIYVAPRMSATLRDVTLAENKSSNSGGGGNLYVDSRGTADLSNTLVTLPFGGGDCETNSSSPAGVIHANGGNAEFASAPSCGLETGGQDLASPTEFGPLASNGGQTPTHALPPGSPALDTGAMTCEPTDQRGAPRPQGTACDPGAYELDTTPPQVSIDSGPSGTVADPNVAFSFSATENATFECALDGAPFAACASPFGAGPLADGAHSFTVRARDVAGNQGGPTTRGFTVQRETGGGPTPEPVNPGGGGGNPGGGGGSTGGGGTGAATLTALQISPSAFRAARRGGSVAAAAGATVRFSLTAGGRVRFTVQRPAKRRKGHRRAQPTTLQGAFRVAGHAGANSFRFTGRLRQRALRPGRYRLIATAPAGKVRSVPFRILAG